MTTSARQDREFQDEVFNLLRTDHLLSTALQWIQQHMSPSEVYPEVELQSWAENNGYVKAEEE